MFFGMLSQSAKRREGDWEGRGRGGLYSWSNIVVLDVIIASLLTTQMKHSAYGIN